MRNHEKKLKGWRRARKIALITETNPDWFDPSDEWEQQPTFLSVPVEDGRNYLRFFASLRMTMARGLL
jgi:hypothetical protein